MFEAKVILDSINPFGIRLVTVELTFARYTQAELNTHRSLSKSSGSSRAVPVAKMIQRVLDEPMIPVSWGKNGSGMQAREDLSPELAARARWEWLRARDSAVFHAKQLLEIGVHKQIVNRLLEPFSWQTVIITSSKWRNFEHLRVHSDAQPEFQVAAQQCVNAIAHSRPTPLAWGEWHLPYVHGFNDERDSAAPVDDWPKFSAARCARVSFLNHDGDFSHEKDIGLHDKLVMSGHMGPLEHQACAEVGAVSPNKTGNLGEGWYQYRKMIPGEHDIYARTGQAQSNLLTDCL